MCKRSVLVRLEQQQIRGRGARIVSLTLVMKGHLKMCIEMIVNSVNFCYFTEAKAN